MGYDSVVPALGLEVIMTLQHLLHPRMVFTYALDTAFQDIGVAAILGVTFGLFTGGVFASLAFFSHFARGSTAFSTWYPGASLFLSILLHLPGMYFRRLCSSALTFLPTLGFPPQAIFVMDLASSMIFLTLSETV